MGPQAAQPLLPSVQRSQGPTDATLAGPASELWHRQDGASNRRGDRTVGFDEGWPGRVKGGEIGNVGASTTAPPQPHFGMHAARALPSGPEAGPGSAGSLWSGGWLRGLRCEPGF